MIIDGVQYVPTGDGRYQNTKTGKVVTYPRGSYDKKKPQIVYMPQSQQVY